ncbi:MAG TPA: hypothetical protein VMU48_16705 [Terracidiphilus sp.]|nr:hypothetical protein [Terracidiphilus sp.]
MSQNPPLAFSNITPAQFAALTAKANSAGMNLAGNSGTASKFGVEVTWNYSPDTQQLTLQCLKTPIFLSAADVHAKLQALVQQSLSAA